MWVLNRRWEFSTWFFFYVWQNSTYIKVIFKTFPRPDRCTFFNYTISILVEYLDMRFFLFMVPKSDISTVLSEIILIQNMQVDTYGWGSYTFQNCHFSLYIRINVWWFSVFYQEENIPVIWKVKIGKMVVNVVKSEV